jgi:hypothetical protein
MQLSHFLAQLLGLYCVIVAAAMFAQKQAMMEIVSGVIQSEIGWPEKKTEICIASADAFV